MLIENKINIALCTDDRYASHAAICVTSILENNKGENCHIYILTEGLNAINIAKFSQLSSIYKQPIDIKILSEKQFEGMQVKPHLPRSMYFRFLLPSIVQDSRVLYLDCDILVRKSLKALFELDLIGYACGVVEDQCGDDIRIHNDIMMFSRYFNSGVLLFNLDYWRENNITKKLCEFILYQERILNYPDQDALNILLEHKVLFLDYEYNFQQLLYGDLIWLSGSKWNDVWKAKKNPAIVHFTSGEKPWHSDCTHPLKHEYDNYMALHSFLAEKKTRGHKLSFYITEWIVGNLRTIYQWYRKKNNMLVNKA